MPFFQTRILNTEFASHDDGRDYPSDDIAIEQSIIAAMEIAREIILKGASSTAVEARLQQDGRIVARHAVTLSMMIAEDAERSI